MKVAILCAHSKTAYREIPDVEIFTRRRDARTFPGGMPVVAHPPCRGWSLKTRHLAKVEAGELSLGIWCADMVRECGGILEQPAGSLLFRAAELPLPGEGNASLWTLECWQAWWHYPTRKATWLCFSRIAPELVEVPFRLHSRGLDGPRGSRMSRRQRSATTRELAEWLVSLARSVA